MGVRVNRDWWVAALGDTPFADEVFETDDGRLRRTQLFRLGERATESPEDARRLLWASVAWGTGRRHRLNRARLRSVLGRQDDVSAALQQAAEVSRTDSRAAYRLMRPGRNTVRYLGPPFFTKFLYFAGGGSPAHPCLVLDSLVAKALRQDCGWNGLTGRYVWSADEYAAYCDLLTRWADELNEDGGDPVRPDQLEYAMFDHGRHS
ncbi:hypothetical protein [Blastococcus sp. CCUG 61487]|uniref:8-oxoguanine DNA glycosylase OGG fold protein n=1 Tax=Blastococcus sp. CCUG 61487 TaxID=1840703 RepID=UPI0032E450D7